MEPHLFFMYIFLENIIHTIHYLSRDLKLEGSLVHWFPLGFRGAAFF